MKRNYFINMKKKVFFVTIPAYVMTKYQVKEQNLLQDNKLINISTECIVMIK